MSTRAAAAKNATTASQGERFKFTSPGDEVYGRVANQRSGTGDYGPWELIEVEDEELGRVTVFLGNKGLEQALLDGDNNLGRPVSVGDTVYVRFEEEISLEGGKTFKKYAVHLEPGRAAARAAAVNNSNDGDEDDLPF